MSKYRNVLEVLAEFVRYGDNLAFGDPLLEILNFSVELEELEALAELVSPLKKEVLEAGIQLVHL